MDDRIIAGFRALEGPGRPFLERARALVERVTARGGVHVGWDASKLTFAFESSMLPAILEIATSVGPDTRDAEPLWGVGIAHGAIERVNEGGSPLLASGLLWWGAPLVAAGALAGLARSGEVLCADSVPALRAGELVTSGLRIARDGTLRVRGARLDRRQPWKNSALDNLTHMTEPPFVSSHVPAVNLEAGALVVLRADPGAGGTRLLREIAAQATRSLFVAPSGSGFEPLGALRRALRRAVRTEVNPLLLELSSSLEALLSGKGVTLDTATKLITAFLWPKEAGTQSALLIDDAKAIDPATLEACTRAVRAAPTIALVARLDRSSGLPSVLATLRKANEHDVATLSREGAEDIAMGCTASALDAPARRRWARLGGGSPLAIIEAITTGIGNGEIAWSTDGTAHRGSPRSRGAGRGKVQPAAKWIRDRANTENAPSRAILSLLAVIGGEAQVSFLARVIEKAGLVMNVPGTVAQLQKARWIVRTQESDGTNEGYVGFPSRTHHKALFNTLEDDTRKKLHVAIARVIEEQDGAFGRVEAAWHAAQAGEGARASAALLEGARAAAEARLEASTTQLIAFARRADPSCEEVALELLANALERAPSYAPPSGLGSSPPSTRPPVTTPSAPPFAAAPVSSRPGARSIPPSLRASIPPSRGPSMAPPARPARGAAASGSRPSRVPPNPPPVIAPAARAAPPPHAMVASAASDGAAGEPDSIDSMVEHAMIVPPGGRRVDLAAFESVYGPDSEPPTMMDEDAPAADTQAEPDFALDPALAREPPIQYVSEAPAPAEDDPSPPASVPGSQIAVRLGELAKEALLAADNAALERWVDGLRAAGESPAYTDRMRAMARLGRGDIGDALRVLRRTRAKLDATDHRRRCQTSLALGVALSVAGRPQEALLEAMDALARARHTSDQRGAKACLAFLARLYTSVGREEDAEQLRARSV